MFLRDKKKPWIRDRQDLSDNRVGAMNMLRIRKCCSSQNLYHARMYNERIEEMIERGYTEIVTLRTLTLG